MSIKYNADTTAEILEKYLFEVMRESKLDSKYVAYNLELTFGDKIHKDIYGFINFMESENENPEEIVIALVHDITGAMTHDTLMIPRVSEYGKHA